MRDFEGNLREFEGMYTKNRKMKKKIRGDQYYHLEQEEVGRSITQFDGDATVWRKYNEKTYVW